MADRERVVDAHYHLWDLEAHYYPWLTDKTGPRRVGDYAAIRRTYASKHHLEDCGGAIAKSVHIQAEIGEDPLRETEWLQHQGETTGFPNAIVFFTDLSKPDVAADIRRHLAFDRVRGIRMMTMWKGDRTVNNPSQPVNWLAHEDWIRGVAALGDHGLTLDLTIFYWQADDAVRLARRYPETQIVVDHAALPLHWDGGTFNRPQFDEWKTCIARLAEPANVSIKLSGFWMCASPIGTAELQPTIDHVVRCFGPERVMFGSNLPIDRLIVPFSRMLGTVREAVSGLPEQQRVQILSGTAERVYRI